MSYEEYENEEMDDETFEDFLDFAELDTPPKITREDVPILENRIEYLEENKRTYVIYLPYVVATMILLFCGFEAAWWVWPIAIYASGTVIFWTGELMRGFGYRVDEIDKLKHWISWNDYE